MAGGTEKLRFKFHFHFGRYIGLVESARPRIDRPCSRLQSAHLEFHELVQILPEQNSEIRRVVDESREADML